MLKIMIDEGLYLTSSPHSFEISVLRDGHLTPIKFYTNLQNTLHAFVQYKIMNSNSTTFIQLTDLLNEIKNKIDGILSEVKNVRETN